MMHLAVCVYACATVPRLRDQLETCRDTWGRDLPTYFFCGEERTDVSGNLVYLPGVSNDYASASHKQWGGLAWMHAHVDPDFVLCVGTDMFVNAGNLRRALAAAGADPAVPQYLGGHGEHRALDKPYYFHCGGPGFVLSRAALARMAAADVFSTVHARYRDLCLRHGAQHLIPACDVAMGVVADRLQLQTLVLPNMWRCTHLGYPCHPGRPVEADIVCCHQITSSEIRYLHDRMRRRDT